VNVLDAENVRLGENTKERDSKTLLVSGDVRVNAEVGAKVAVGLGPLDLVKGDVPAKVLVPVKMTVLARIDDLEMDFVWTNDRVFENADVLVNGEMLFENCRLMENRELERKRLDGVNGLVDAGVENGLEFENDLDRENVRD
jgi:hypothetical protein